jgi:hypothetical protein
MNLASNTASELSTTPSSVAACPAYPPELAIDPHHAARQLVRGERCHLSLWSRRFRGRRPVRTRRAVEKAEGIRDFAETTHRAKSWSRERPRHRTHRSASTCALS